ncbi:multifunctional CCA addition/repair protein [Alteromonas sp. ASW11-36]|uniref:Multifunctional CCA addition/repair protein n=1 Tax=Alteromonas arenosi TaxID=3055817 RepID=A0ABT7SWA5_9ALTE|nr:multifunctional CCA addition/repair protein [Alteromonas sp. ASW11-36]MDM7860448.1 multifunctional CCA addition/repair protein [Alteromonas sp. ASW11-36]
MSLNVYLVGGAVRDQLMGKDAHDKDYVVVGATPVQMKKLGYQSVGADFPVFLHPETKDEYALARTERKSGRGYHGFVVDASESVTLEEDLARRDLTINSMAQDASGNIVDPFNGQQDLANKVLRHTTEAFCEDPVRVLRVARFLARFGDDWSIHADTLALMQQMQIDGELDHLVAERVWKEMEKALGEPHPDLFFKTLDGLGIFPEIEVMHGVEQPQQYHPEGDVFIHTMLTLRRAAELGFSRETVFACLTHDFGKPVTYQMHGNLHGHEQAGVSVVEAFCERWRVPTRYKQLGMLTSENHTRLHRMFELTPKKLHRLIITSMNALEHPERFEQFVQACQCDAQGRGETLREKPYKQADFARTLVNDMKAFDKKAAVQEALSRGRTGPAIGEAVRVSEIDWIRQYIKQKA